MQQTISIKLSPSEAMSADIIRSYLSSHLGIPENRISGFNILKRSLDARGRRQFFLLTLEVFIDEPFHQRKLEKIEFGPVHKSRHSVIVTGAGPAGLFAALRLIELGIKPIVIERGKDVRARRRDLAALNKDGILNSESNYCFGEGGAGTYSDGKLYTRSTKRGDLARILNILVQFGADESILYDAHPHIGTNKLPAIITAMRDQIIKSGGEVFFNTKLEGLNISDGRITGVRTGADFIDGKALILATGHSARDIFLMLASRKIAIESKPFALGVRVEHPQSLIDSIQYHQPTRDELLPPASYSLVQQVQGLGVFSFCMCPGGIIAPASTNEGELVVNGWSPSKRNNPFANSGIVVSINEKDIATYINRYGALGGMFFQQSVEQKAFEQGGGKYVAPAQALADFVANKRSAVLPECSYLPGVHSSRVDKFLPAFVSTALQGAFKEFGKRLKGYLSNDALMVATESRTSSPVRIPRDAETLQHPQIAGLYPCAEGAGYAGGIVSAAMDGERVATAVASQLV